MPKPKRARTRIRLPTAEDTSLWRYNSVSEALVQNVDILARLAQSGLPSHDEEPIQGVFEYGHMKENRQLEKV
jgi:hypothetical protein